MSRTITAPELKDFGDAMLVDIRDSSAFEYGHISGAVNIPQEQVLTAERPRDKKIVIYCKGGIISGDIAEQLCDKGYDAYELAGGYVEWLRGKMEQRDVTEAVELSLRKKFKKYLHFHLYRLCFHPLSSKPMFHHL